MAQRCESPLCSVEFEPSGLPMEPKRFCSDQCKQEASLIRRVAKLLEGYSDQEKLNALKVTR